MLAILLRPTGLLLLAIAALSCAHRQDAPKPHGADECALIVTDDDIPSGSATAGALYVGEDALGRRLLTADVLAVAQGFRDAGYRCVEASDSHREALDAKALAQRGIPVHTPANEAKWVVPFIGPAGRRYRVAALVGFHAMARSAQGFRAHTVNDYVGGATMNARPIGEVTIMALGITAVGMKLVLVTGDEAAAAEARALSPQLEAVSVRWHLADGRVGFLSEQDAGRTLREAARRGASAPPPFAFSFPAKLTLAAISPKRAQSALAQMRSQQGELSAFLKLIGHPDFSVEPAVESQVLRWSTPGAATAFATLVSAACACKPAQSTEAWSWIEKGARAYSAGQHEQALAAYQRALTIDPSDLATRCRMGQVLRAMKRLDEAASNYRDALEQVDEIGPGMVPYCHLGLAQTLEQAGSTDEAAKHYQQVLSSTQAGRESRARAREALRRLRH